MRCQRFTFSNIYSCRRFNSYYSLAYAVNYAPFALA